MKKIKNKKKYNFFAKLMLLITIILFSLLGYLNVLPLFYYALLLVICVFFEGILYFLLSCTRVKEKIRYKAFLLSVILDILFIIMSLYLFKTILFINTITDVSEEITNYYILVNSSSSISSLEEIKNKKMGFYNLNENPNDKIPVAVDYDPYSDLNKMYDDLIENKIDSMVIEESIRNVIEESNAEYKNNTKVIYEFQCVSSTINNSKGVNTTNESFNLYISGIDTYGNISSISRSDVNIVASINPNTKTILLTSIPRDYYVALYGKSGYKDKLTHAGIYGIGNLIKTIENLLNIDINYYIKVNFTSLIDIVDVFGGITVNSDYDFTAFDGETFKKGYNDLNGKRALSFARERHSFNDGDRQRGKNQQEIIKAIINKATTSVIISKYDDILNVAKTKVKTNMSQKEMTNIIKKQISNNSSWNILTNNLDGKNSMEYTYSYKTNKLYVMIPDEEQIKLANIEINEVLGK